MTPAVTLGRLHRAILTGCVVGASVAGWLWLVSMPHSGHTASLLPAILMWQAMTLAMMTPTILTWLFAFAAFAQANPARIGAFAIGYFLAWTAYSVAGAGLQMAVHRIGFSEPVPNRLAAAVLIGAGIVHLTPFTQSCLRHCRNPLTYFLQHWNSAAPPSALRIGLVHGVYCIGCCWALMLTGFALGLMNLAWMAALTIVVCIEKMAPIGELPARLTGFGLIGWGAALFIR